jgi:hypothetical protein
VRRPGRRCAFFFHHPVAAFTKGRVFLKGENTMNPVSASQRNERRVYLLQATIAALMIFVAAALRILPHPWNFTPVGAMAVFAGSLFRNRWFAFLLPLAALFAGDLFVGLYKLMFVVYASFALSVAIGRWLARSRTVARIGGAVFLGALQFFAVSNFALWALGDFYPRTATGLAACFTAAIPYFSNTLAGDALYATVLFGGYALAARIFSAEQLLANEASPVAAFFKPRDFPYHDRSETAVTPAQNHLRHTDVQSHTKE